jgi:hypothetical protein
MATNQSMTRKLHGYGIHLKDVLQKRDWPEFDFSIFRGMDEQYDKIRSDYRRTANNRNYSAEYKLQKKQEALAAIRELKTTYHDKATKWIDKTYRKPKPKIKKPTYSSDRILWELERNKELAVLEKQLQVEPPAKLLELYNQYKDTNDEAVTLIELELRQRKDKGGTNESARAMHAWAEIQADLHAGDLVAEHHETQLISALHPDDQWYPRGLEKGYREAKYEPIEL